MAVLATESKKFIFTLVGQLTKNVQIMVKSGYLIALSVMVIASSVFLVFYPPAHALTVSYKIPLITNSLFVFYSTYIGNFWFVFLVIPIILAGEDIENKNMEIMKTTRFNAAGYLAGTILSMFLMVLIPLIELGYISEAVVFGGGYRITSGVLLDPLLIGTSYLTIFLVPILVISFISMLISSKVISIITVLVLIFTAISVFSQVVYSHRITYYSSTLNGFLYTFGAIFEQGGGLQCSLLGSPSSIYGNSVYSQSSIFHFTLIFSIIFIALDYVLILIRKHSSYISEKFIGFLLLAKGAR